MDACNTFMRLSPRFRIAASVVVLASIAACSRSSEQPKLSDDLKQDLAKVGGSDIQLAGPSAPRVDVVSAAERNDAHVPTPHAPSVTRIASANRGTRAAVHSAHHVTPAPAQSAAAADVAPAEAPVAEPTPVPTPRAAGRPSAPQPTTQREPRGGWKTEGEVFRNAPFPINP